MRGDGDGFNPRKFAYYNLVGGGEMIAGVFQDDGRADNRPRRADVPFRIFLPPDFQAWQGLNARIFQALKSRQSPVTIDMRFVAASW